ncbi:hypothetical protein RI054_19g85470 [Pseudoscourfieldia marina]
MKRWKTEVVAASATRHVRWADEAAEHPTKQDWTEREKDPLPMPLRETFVRATRGASEMLVQKKEAGTEYRFFVPYGRCECDVVATAQSNQVHGLSDSSRRGTHDFSPTWLTPCITEKLMTLPPQLLQPWHLRKLSRKLSTSVDFWSHLAQRKKVQLSFTRIQQELKRSSIIRRRTGERNTSRSDASSSSITSNTKRSKSNE